MIELLAILALSLTGGWLTKEILESYLAPRRTAADQQRQIAELERELEIGEWADVAERRRAYAAEVGEKRAWLRGLIESDWSRRATYRVVVKDGGVWHVYEDGRKVLIRR